MKVLRTIKKDLVHVNGNKYLDQVELRFPQEQNLQINISKSEARRLRDCLTAQIKRLRHRKKR